MQSTERIVGLQAFWLLWILVIATSGLMIPSATAAYAGRDMWISTVLAVIPSGLIVGLTLWLHRRYPGTTLIEQLILLLGGVVGRILALSFMYGTVFATAILVREATSLFTITVLPKTPPFFMACLLTGLSVWAVTDGIEVLSRCGQLIGILVGLVFFELLFLALPEIHFESVRPVLEHGFTPVLRGAFGQTAFAGELVLATFLWPILSNSRSAKLVGIGSVLGATGITLLGNLSIWGVFANRTESLILPFFDLVRYVQEPTLQRIESLAVTTWTCMFFLKIGFLLYVGSVGIAQVTGLSNYRCLVLPLGLLVAILSQGLYQNVLQVRDDLRTSWSIYILVFEYGMPLIVLVASLMRGRGSPPAVTAPTGGTSDQLFKKNTP